MRAPTAQPSAAADAALRLAGREPGDQRVDARRQLCRQRRGLVGLEQPEGLEAGFLLEVEPALFLPAHVALAVDDRRPPLRLAHVLGGVAVGEEVAAGADVADDVDRQRLRRHLDAGEELAVQAMYSSTMTMSSSDAVSPKSR